MGACSEKPAHENEIPLVVVTTTHLYDLVDSLAGERVQVLSLMGPGVDPHGYKPTSRDLSSLRFLYISCFVFLYVSSHLTHCI